MISIKPICNHVIVLDTIFENNYFCAENNKNYIYSCEKLHKKCCYQSFLTQICTKSFVGWGFAPDSTRDAYSVPPDPLAVFRGPTSKGGEERAGEE